MRFRQAMREIVPLWLRTGLAAKILYSIGVQLDAIGDAINYAVRLRLTNVYSPEGLAYQGRDRRMPRGVFESDAAYAARLRDWFARHARRGNPYALLEALRAHYAPNHFEITLIYDSGRRFTMNPTTGVITRDEAPAWTPPSNPPVGSWARWWLFYDWPFYSVSGDDGLWGSPGLWGDGGIWGQGLSGPQIDELRLIPEIWNSAHAVGYVVLEPSGATLQVR